MKLPNNVPAKVLQTAIDTMVARGKSRDQGKERSMAKTVDMFNAFAGTDISETEGWVFMVMLKLSRATTRYDYDNFVDAAAYIALAQESEVKAEKAEECTELEKPSPRIPSTDEAAHLSRLLEESSYGS